MALLSSGERLRKFDGYIQSVDMALRHPEIVRRLGALAAVLLGINGRAYLPNIRRDRLETPREYRHDHDRVAIIPITPEEEPMVQRMITWQERDLNDWQRLERRVRSPYSGYEQDDVTLFRDFIDDRSVSRRDKLSYPRGDPVRPVHATMAMTYAHVEIMEQGGAAQRNYLFRRSRPFITINDDVLWGRSPWVQGAALAHDEVHTAEVLSNGVLYSTRRGAAASELVGYFVTDLLMSMALQEDELGGFARSVETWRRRQLGVGNFIPNDEQVRYLESIGAVE